MCDLVSGEGGGTGLAVCDWGEVLMISSIPVCTRTLVSCLSSWYSTCCAADIYRDYGTGSPKATNLFFLSTLNTLVWLQYRL